MRRCSRLLACLSLAFSISFGAMTPMSAQDAQSAQPKYTYRGKNISKSQYEALVLFNDSISPMWKGDYALAKEKLEAAIELDPNLYQARTNFGFLLGRMGRVDEGIAQLKKALEIDPTRPEAIDTIAAMYQSSGRLPEAIAAYKDALQRYPNHPLSPAIASVVKQLEVENRRQQSIEKAIPAADREKDYFAYTTWDATTKWAAHKIPLKVYIPTEEECRQVKSYRSEYGQALRQAFADWEQASGGAVKYVFVDNPKDADIDCLWTSDPTKVARPAEGGEARVAYDTRNGISHVQIILLTVTPDITDQGIPINIIKVACLHEIGHSLGLIGHSPDANDVMFCSMPAADQERKLTERDGRTVAHLYREDVKLGYQVHGPADSTDKSSLNNEGVNLAASQQFSKAAERFEAALKIDPTYEPAKQNLSACLNNLAIELAKNNKWADAASKFKRAIELQQNAKDKVKLATTMRNYAYVLSRLNRMAEAQSVKAASEKLVQDQPVAHKGK